MATVDSALHLLSYNIKKAELSVDFVIERSHSEEGVGGLEKCAVFDWEEVQYQRCLFVEAFVRRGE